MRGPGIYFFAQDADGGFCIHTVHNGKTRIQANVGSIFPQDAVAKRVKSAPGDFAAAAIQQFGGPL